MMITVRHYAPAVLSGIVLFLAFPASNAHFLAWVALVPLVWKSTSLSPRAAALHFLIAGWIFHTLTLQWLAANIFWAGGWALWGQQFMVWALTLFWALSGWLWRTACQRSSFWGGALLLAALFVIVEWIHAHTLTGFGWPALAHSQGPDLPLLQWAALGGTSAVAFILVLFNALVALALARKPRRYIRLACAAFVLVAAHGLGYLMMQPATHAEKPLRVGVFQANYPNEMKWDQEYVLDMVDSAVMRSRALKQHENVDLVVWPEAHVMYDYTQPEILDRLTTLAREESLFVFTGTVRTDPETRAGYNSSVLIDPRGQVVDVYDKVHLAPFGEYDPFGGMIPGIGQVVPGGVTHGAGQKVLSVGEHTLGPLICFETLFAAMAANLRAQGADFLVVITNLAWFGASNAVPQEIELARLRAIETRLPLVHAANTGISGVFDPYGRLQAVNDYVTPSGGYIRGLTKGGNPRATMGRRLVGAFDLASPAGIRSPAGQRFAPLAALAGAGALLLLALRAKAESHPDGASKARAAG